MYGCYIRVSSKDQKHDSQRAAIAEWLERNGIKDDKVLWFEDVETARTLNRKALKELEIAIFNGRVQTVVVWKLDRLSRRMLDGVNTLARWCERGTRVVSITQQIDLSGSLGGMLAAVLFSLAEIEWDYRRERQAAGIKVAREKGAYKGRKKGTTKSNPERVLELLAKAAKPIEIARFLGISERTVFRYLQQQGGEHISDRRKSVEASRFNA